jgi:hypothetical protein
MEKKKEFEVTKDEIAKAVAIYVAGESGIIENVSPEEAGHRGALIADLTETGQKLINGEITKEQAEKEIVEKTVYYAIAPFVDKVIDVSIEFAARLLEKRLPAVSKFIRNIKEPMKTFLREKVVKKTIEVAEKAWSKIKVSFKKLLGR